MTDLAKPTAELDPRLADARAQAASAWAQAASAWARAMELQQRNEEIMAEAQAAKQVRADARRERQSTLADRELLHRSEFARLLARLETMPVIEQAKGIIMAQSHCGEAEAFTMLRQASQRSNVPVRELAAQIVANTVRTGTPAAVPDTHSPASRHPDTRLLPAS
jgi:ANTAR domain-containing protein